MNTLDKNFELFIEHRIDDTITSLKKDNKNYKNKLKEYNKLYHELYNNLPKNLQIKLDKLLNISNNLSNDELVSMYKNATYDFINQKNFFNNN